MIREYDKKILRVKFNGNIEEATRAGYYTDWTQEMIRGAFNCGNGTEKDLKQYMQNNKQYCIFKEVKNV